MKDYEVKFEKSTKEHIEMVNRFARKLGLEFPEHDSDKLTTLFKGYSLMAKEDRTAEEQRLVDTATYFHVTTQNHHPEKHSDADLTGFSRSNPIPNGPIDVSKMPEDAILEMLCDWCSMSVKFNNTPFEWFSAQKDSRWIFSKEQENFILDTLKTLWDSKDEILNYKYECSLDLGYCINYDNKNNCSSCKRGKQLN